jgi:hypothetical protein
MKLPKKNEAPENSQGSGGGTGSLGAAGFALLPVSAGFSFDGRACSSKKAFNVSCLITPNKKKKVKSRGLGNKND